MTAVQTEIIQSQLITSCVDLLTNWTSHANSSWTWLSPIEATSLAGGHQHTQSANKYTPVEPVAGYYGTGYASWGVMAQAATVGVFGVLARATGDQSYLERCQKGLRYLFGTHAAGPLWLTDGTKWGAKVSSHDEQYAALWIEQGMLAYDLADKDVDSYDRALIRGVLVAEANSYLAMPVSGGLGPGAGKAESNALKAAVLARAALLYPRQAHAEQWRQKSCEYWMNAVSVDRDATDNHLVRGRPVRHWHRATNFHAHYGVTHRGFFHPSDIALTLGVMANTALMHVRRGHPVPIETFHHWHEALGLITRLYLWDNTLACVGGQTWPRFTWDQIMLLPALVWAGTRHTKGPKGEDPVLASPDALEMAKGILNHVSAEQGANGDGSFFSRRLSTLRAETEWGYLRYEAGTAFALATAYAILTCDQGKTTLRGSEPIKIEINGSDQNGEGYQETSLGTVWHKTDHRFASWCWQACGIPAQGLVIPRSGVRLPEWNGNMVGTVRLKEHQSYHALQYHREHQFTGGFATLGLLAEQLPMWPMADKTPSLRHGMAFFALPDGRTSILLDLVWSERQVSVVENKGLLYKLANDLTNGNRRTITTQNGEREIRGIGANAEVWQPNSPWLVVDNSLFVMPFWGGELVVGIRGERYTSGSRGESTLLWDEICAPFSNTYTRLRSGETLRDTCTAYVCNVTGDDGHSLASRLYHTNLVVQTVGNVSPRARVLQVSDLNGVRYILGANFDRADIGVLLPSSCGLKFVAGAGQLSSERLVLPPASLTICRCD